ncbi:hypothetical protein BDY21DRAFT_358308 [Lineolata rhizophorae]|uniref:Uncharacterized protein n=1 Tax=Lineolata rhizophorae TaxID=578093 RepID=A0A6A6NM62_9PEZI|nr:hypothetical protein BDY21DRAFT_358308 [Lineolata rhizophorae]
MSCGGGVASEIRERAVAAEAEAEGDGGGLIVRAWAGWRALMAGCRLPAPSLHGPRAGRKLGRAVLNGRQDGYGACAPSPPTRDDASKKAGERSVLGGGKSPVRDASSDLAREKEAWSHTCSPCLGVG